MVGIRHRSEDSVRQCPGRRLSGAWIETEDGLDEQKTLLLVAEGRSPPAVGGEPATRGAFLIRRLVCQSRAYVLAELGGVEDSRA